MLINPSQILNISAPEYHYVPYHPEFRDHWNVACTCNQYKLVLIELLSPSINDCMLIVRMVGDQFANKKEITVTIWHGICERCKKLYWSCDRWDWVSWLNDYQILATVLPVAGIQHIRYDFKDGSVIKVESATALYFEKGTIIGRKG